MTAKKPAPTSSPLVQPLTRAALVALPAATLAALAGLLPLRSWDYWWHLSIGRLIAHYGRIPGANHFLYTAEPDAPSTIVPWAGQWLLYALHNIAGLDFALAVQNLSIAAALLLATTLAARRADRLPNGLMGALVAATLAMPLALFSAILSPAWAVAPLALALAAALDHARRDAHAPTALRFAMALGPVAASALWANLHGAWWIPALMALALAADAALTVPRAGRPRPWRQVGLWTGSSALATLAAAANPRQWQIFGETRAILALGSDAGQIPALLPTIALGASLLVLMAARMRGPREGAAWHTGLVLILGIQAILYPPATLWLALVLPLALAPAIAQIADAVGLAPRYPRPLGAPASLAILALLASLSLALQPVTKAHISVASALALMPTRSTAPLRGKVSPEVPVTCTANIADSGARPRIYHDRRYAGYLLYHLTDHSPEQRLFLDPRQDIAPDAIEELDALMGTTPIARGVLQQFGVEAAVLSTKRQKEAIADLRREPRWYETGADSEVVCFVRR